MPQSSHGLFPSTQSPLALSVGSFSSHVCHKWSWGLGQSLPVVLQLRGVGTPKGSDSSLPQADKAEFTSAGESTGSSELSGQVSFLIKPPWSFKKVTDDTIFFKANMKRHSKSKF